MQCLHHGTSIFFLPLCIKNIVCFWHMQLLVTQQECLAWSFFLLCGAHDQDIKNISAIKLIYNFNGSMNWVTFGSKPNPNYKCTW